MIHVTPVAGAVLLLPAGLGLSATVVDHTGDVLVPAGQPLSLECTADRSWQDCRWTREGVELSTADGRVVLTTVHRTCGVRVHNVSLDDGGEFSCVLRYDNNDDPMVVRQKMTVEVVASELEMVRREKAELERENTDCLLYTSPSPRD